MRYEPPFCQAPSLSLKLRVSVTVSCSYSSPECVRSVLLQTASSSVVERSLLTRQLIRGRCLSPFPLVCGGAGWGAAPLTSLGGSASEGQVSGVGVAGVSASTAVFFLGIFVVSCRW